MSEPRRGWSIRQPGERLEDGLICCQIEVLRRGNLLPTVGSKLAANLIFGVNLLPKSPFFEADL
jgi:hypothetical protein